MRVAITGAAGQLGVDVVEALTAGGHEPIAFDRARLDVTDAAAARSLIAAARADAVVHAAAWTDVDGCEREPDRAQLVNAQGTANVARAAGESFVVVVGTDYVFDGTLGRAYREDDPTNPIQAYGITKRAGEELALDIAPHVAVVRSAWLYGARTAAGPARNFVTAILDAAARGRVDVVEDQVGSPTATLDLARAIVRLLERPRPGVFHVVNEGIVSRYAFAREIVASAGLPADLVRPVSTEAAPPRPARRPPYAPLEGAAWRGAGFGSLPDWRDALARTLSRMEVRAP